MTRKVYIRRRRLTMGCASSEHSLAGNVDLLTQIFLRVPAKSLIRFKCVCKHWLSLISDPQFACNHAHQNPSSLNSGLYYGNRLTEQLTSIPLHGHPSLPTLTFLRGVGEDARTMIEHSLNGLLLCSNGYRHYIVCNPTTQKYKLLPKPRENLSESCRANLAFDPSKSPHYKVVLISYLFPSYSSYQIDIYYSESTSWKHLHLTELVPARAPITDKIFWNGSIHWMTGGNVYFRFDLDAEKLTGTQFPPRPSIFQDQRIRYFGECGGHLLLISIRRNYAVGYRILEMDMNSCLWFVKCQVNLKPITSVFPEMVLTNRLVCKYNVLCVVKGANEQDFTLMLAILDKIISYSPNCPNRLKVLCDLSPCHKSTYSLNARAYQFIESLSPV